jgi:hypothetical protein
MKNIILPSIAALAMCLAAPEAYAAEEEQDWYAWYEQQNAQVAEQAADEYAQYYEETSPDQYQDNYGTESPGQNDGNAEASALGGIGDYEYEDETWEEAPQPESGQILDSEPDWIWADAPPNQVQEEETTD